MLTTFFLCKAQVDLSTVPQFACELAEKILYPKKKTKPFFRKESLKGKKTYNGKTPWEKKKQNGFVSKKETMGVSQKKQDGLYFQKKQSCLSFPKTQSSFIFQPGLSKRGSGWLLFFFVVFLTLMGGALMYEVEQLRQPGSVEFGEKQIALFQLYGDSEEKVLGLREYVRRARDEGVLELASNGGFSKDNACGKWQGEVVWDYDKCWPDVERNFQLLMERKFGERGLWFERIFVADGKLRVAFGNLEFSRDFADGKVTYTRNITIEEDAGLDFAQIQTLKRKLIEARNKGDYSGLGKVEAGYLRLSIENDKNALRLLQGEGFVVEKPHFIFQVKTS